MWTVLGTALGTILECEGKVWLPLGFTSTFVLAQVPEEASDTRHRPSALLDSQKLLG